MRFLVAGPFSIAGNFSSAADCGPLADKAASPFRGSANSGLQECSAPLAEPGAPDAQVDGPRFLRRVSASRGGGGHQTSPRDKMTEPACSNSARRRQGPPMVALFFLLPGHGNRGETVSIICWPVRCRHQIRKWTSKLGQPPSTSTLNARTDHERSQGQGLVFLDCLPRQPVSASKIKGGPPRTPPACRLTRGPGPRMKIRRRHP